MRVAVDVLPEPSVRVQPGDSAIQDAPPFLLQLASRLAEQVQAHCRETRDGHPTWGPLTPPDAPKGVRPDGYWDLYIGVSGIALFLAACHRVTGSGQCRTLCMRAMEPVRRLARRVAAGGDRASLCQAPPGAFVGIGSLIYGLLTISRLLDDPELAEEAHGLTCSLSLDILARDNRLDVVHGSAGTLLTLLALHRVSPGPNRHGDTPLEIAAACGRHLLACRTAHSGHPRAWITQPGLPPHSGFAHGAAGIVLALGRLFRWTGQTELLEAVREGLAFERSLFLAREGNWKRHPGGPCSTAGWCYGAPGIALSRLGLLDCIPGDRSVLEEEARAALDTTLSAAMDEADHLCCGNLGRAEILLYAFQTTGEPGFHNAALDLSRRVAKAATARGRFAGDMGSRLDASLFRGAAGVGYAYLRLLDPTLPCFLILD